MKNPPTALVGFAAEPSPDDPRCSATAIRNNDVEALPRVLLEAVCADLFSSGTDDFRWTVPGDCYEFRFDGPVGLHPNLKIAVLQRGSVLLGSRCAYNPTGQNLP